MRRKAKKKSHLGKVLMPWWCGVAWKSIRSSKLRSRFRDAFWASSDGEAIDIDGSYLRAIMRGERYCYPEQVKFVEDYLRVSKPETDNPLQMHLLEIVPLSRRKSTPIIPKQIAN